MRAWLVLLLCLFGTQAYKVSKESWHKSAKETVKWPTLDGNPPSFAAHRGEKVILPEHTEGAYELAAIEGADYVEPDLVFTKDGHLVCFHDLTLLSTTNVKDLPQFADKETTLTDVIDEDGEDVTIANNWFIKDFTLEELKQLTVKQALVGIRPQFYNHLFEIPTFEEYLEIVHHKAYTLKKAIGIIPELKHPMWHNKIWTQRFMEEEVLRILHAHGYPVFGPSNPPQRQCVSPRDGNNTITCGNAILQSFELSSIKYLRNRTQGNVDLMMLIDIQYPLLTYQGLTEMAEYATYFAPNKELLYMGIEAVLAFQNETWDKDFVDRMGGFIPPRDIVRESHALSMKVGTWTIYDSREPSRRGCSIKCDPENKEMELFYYFELGVDSIFVENVPEAREYRIKYEYEVIRKQEDTPSSAPLFGGKVYLIVFQTLVVFVLMGQT